MECSDGDATYQKQYPKENIPYKVTALKCAYLANYSYEEYSKVQGKINSMSTKFNFNHLNITTDLNNVTSSADTQGFVAIDETNCEVFIAFRGTESFQDIINDVNLYGHSEMSSYGGKGTDDFATFLKGFNKALLPVYESKI